MRHFCLTILSLVILCSCSGGFSRSAGAQDGDTLQLKYAEHLTIIRHQNYTEVHLADPWNEGRTLHTYLLVPQKDDSGKPIDIPEHLPEGTVVRTPLQRSVVATSVHCGLIHSFGKEKNIAGVCDLQYINIPFVQQGCKNGRIANCGSGLQPTLEISLDLQPDAMFLSPFQNSGGYGRLEKLGIPIIETADYMETSALGRAEWMRFYGMLFGAETAADSIVCAVEAKYRQLKERAKSDPAKVSTIMDKLTGSVWYVPGGQSTIGRLIQDANIQYPWHDDTHSGSLALPFESVLEQGVETTLWFFRYNAPTTTTLKALLTEENGYKQFRAFQSGDVYGCNTGTTTFYEDTPFHPDLLLRDFICIAHPRLGLGEPSYFKKLN